jgi:hypothetical protein
MKSSFSLLNRFMNSTDISQKEVSTSWRHFFKKNASLPTESQALYTSTNFPKKKTTRKRNLPEGPARYDISSPEWENILIEQASKKPGLAVPRSPKKE